MSKRLIQTYSDTASGYSVKVYRDSEWDEYAYVPFLHGLRFSSAHTGHTDDKADALSSAQATLRMLVDRSDSVKTAREDDSDAMHWDDEAAHCQLEDC